LVLAVWVFHPWAAVAHADILHRDNPVPRVQNASSVRSVADASLARQERLDAPAPVPTPAPAPAPEPTPEPAQPPTPAATPIPVSAMSKSEIEALVCTYPWPCAEALKVLWCESGGKPWAIGRGSNYGLFQINQVHGRRFSNFWNTWMDPAKNIEWAYSIWARQGWKPWGCKPSY
jgi:hypothetical protein